MNGRVGLSSPEQLAQQASRKASEVALRMDRLARDFETWKESSSYDDARVEKLEDTCRELERLISAPKVGSSSTASKDVENLRAELMSQISKQNEFFMAEMSSVRSSVAVLETAFTELSGRIESNRDNLDIFAHPPSVDTKATSFQESYLDSTLEESSQSRVDLSPIFINGTKDDIAALLGGASFKQNSNTLQANSTSSSAKFFSSVVEEVSPINSETAMTSQKRLSILSSAPASSLTPSLKPFGSVAANKLFFSVNPANAIGRRAPMLGESGGQQLVLGTPISGSDDDLLADALASTSESSVPRLGRASPLFATFSSTKIQGQMLRSMKPDNNAADVLPMPIMSSVKPSPPVPSSPVLLDEMPTDSQQVLPMSSMKPSPLITSQQVTPIILVNPSDQVSDQDQVSQQGATPNPNMITMESQRSLAGSSSNASSFSDLPAISVSTAGPMENVGDLANASVSVDDSISPSSAESREDPSSSSPSELFDAPLVDQNQKSLQTEDVLRSKIEKLEREIDARSAMANKGGGGGAPVESVVAKVVEYDNGENQMQQKNKSKKTKDVNNPSPNIGPVVMELEEQLADTTLGEKKKKKKTGGFFHRLFGRPGGKKNKTGGNVIISA